MARVPRLKDPLEDKAAARQDLFRAMAGRKSQHFRALSHDPMPKEARRKRGCAVPFRLVPSNP